MSDDSQLSPSRYWFRLMFYGGPKGCFEYELRDGSIIGFVDFDSIEYSPTAKDWGDFKAELERIGVWKWHESYVDEMAPTCGVDWRFEIEWGDRQVKSSGYERFPSKFKSLVKAARNLCSQAIQEH